MSQRESISKRFGPYDFYRDPENINIVLWNPKATSQQAADALREIADFVAGGAGRGGEGK